MWSTVHFPQHLESFLNYNNLSFRHALHCVIWRDYFGTNRIMHDSQHSIMAAFQNRVIWTIIRIITVIYIESYLIDKGEHTHTHTHARMRTRARERARTRAHTQTRAYRTNVTGGLGGIKGRRQNWNHFVVDDDDDGVCVCVCVCTPAHVSVIQALSTCLSMSVSYRSVIQAATTC